MAGKNQHVTPRPDGRWQVIGAGNSKATAVTNTQKEAADIDRDRKQLELKLQEYELRKKLLDDGDDDSNLTINIVRRKEE